MAPPNILFVFADQLRYDSLACSGNRIVRTPRLDRMAGEGVAFDQAFSSCPICSPYRGQILTGNYSHVNGVMCNEYRLFDDQRTLAQRLGQHGYRSAWIGKWHLGRGPYPPEKRHGFDDLLAHNCLHHYYKVSYHHNERGPIPIREYAPEGETRLTLQWIADHRREHPDTPFFAVLSWGPPHWTEGEGRGYRWYPQEYCRYRPEDVDVPANVPEPLRAFAAGEFADYYGMVTSLDACMGRLLDGLEEMGLGDDTIVCFSSDHGDHMYAHGYGKDGDHWMHSSRHASKATPYEESIRIPLIVRYPRRVPAGRRSETMFNSVDVPSTLMALAELPAPEGVQGRDLSHAALGRAGEEPDSVYLQILGPGWPHRRQWAGLWRGVRTREYVYARWHDLDGMRVLYDLRSDPLEMHNLAGRPEHAGLLEQAEERLRRWMAQTGDPFDTGRRLGETRMLDLGQALTSRKAHQWLPPEYARAIEPNYGRFRTGDRIEFT